jgi:hypothetical protein
LVFEDQKKGKGKRNEGKGARSEVKGKREKCVGRLKFLVLSS